MAERLINKGIPPTPPVIPGIEPASLPHTRAKSLAINTPPLYRSMEGLFSAMSDLDDPDSPGNDYNMRFLNYMSTWHTLGAGNTVLRNNFWLESRDALSRAFPQRNTTMIEGQIGGQTFVLKHQTEPTDLVLVDDLLVGRSGERDIGHAVDTATGRERAIRNNFWSTEQTEAELHTIQTLARLGYPVPQNATAHQLFFPWVDTITYDWIPGVALDEIITTALSTGNQQQALDIAHLFGQHLAQVWKPLLDGPLPDGSVYRFPDNFLGNYIYTGNPTPEEAFVRIDVGVLDHDISPLGSDAYLADIETELVRYPDSLFSNAATPLTEAIRTGFASQ